MSSLPAAPPTATGWSITNWRSSRTRPLSSGRSLTATSPASAWRISQRRSLRGVSLPSKIPPSGRFAVSSTFCAMKNTLGTHWYKRPMPQPLSPTGRRRIRARRINTSSKKPIRPSSVRKCSTRSSSFYPEKVLPFRPGLVSPIPSPARSCADTAERSASERYAAVPPIGYVRRMRKVPKAVSPCKRPNRRSQKPSSVYTSVSSGTGRKFSHNSSKLSRLPRPEDFSGVRISFHSTIESQILQVRNDCWPSSSSRPSSILTFLYPAVTNWLNSAAKQS